MDVVGDLMRVAVSGNNPIAIGKAVGVDKDKAQTLIRVSLPLVLGSMATTAAKPGGTEIVAKMLTQAGASNPIDNLGGFLSNPAAAGGSAMVSSLFGTQTETLQNVIAQKSGVPPAVISKVMAIAAPMVAGYVGKMFIEQKMNPSGLASLLGIQSKMAMQASPEAATLFKELMALK